MISGKQNINKTLDEKKWVLINYDINGSQLLPERNAKS